MDWKFWRNKKSVKNQVLESLMREVSLMNGKLSSMEGHLEKYNDKLHVTNEYLDNNQELIQKSLRLQYKYFQDILKEIEQLNNKIDKTSTYSEKYIEILRHNENLSKEKDYIIERYIHLLDDLDLIYDNLNMGGQEYWIQLFGNWQNQILKSLELVGLYEIDILGKSFNSSVAESINTEKKEINKEYKPYEIVKILQRGFILEDGTLLRKAKVVTVEEEDIEENEER